MAQKTDRLSLTPLALRVMECAANAAQLRGDKYVGSEHILLALSMCGGIAGRVLDREGLTPQALGPKIDAVLSGNSSLGIELGWKA